MRSYYSAVLSGRKRGLLAAAFKAVLSALSLLYWMAHKSRQWAYSLGLLRRVRLPVPVVSVGNLTAGGTGKTPLVEHLARKLASQRLRTAILARGYGKIDADRDDESLALEFESVVRLTGADRVASAKTALGEFRPDAILLDDGFQHFRIRRDLDILAVDATNPFSGGRLLPRGFLRERPANAARADLIVLTRTDQIPQNAIDALREQLAVLSGGKPIVESIHRPVALRSLWNKRRHEVEWLRGRTVYGFCGIGNPEAFRKTLQGAGASVLKFRAFPDHHPYDSSDVRLLNLEAQEFMAEAFVTTEKDAHKLRAEGFEKPIFVLRVELEITRGEDLLNAALLEIVRARRPAATEALPR